MSVYYKPAPLTIYTVAFIITYSIEIDHVGKIIAPVTWAYINLWGPLSTFIHILLVATIAILCLLCLHDICLIKSQILLNLLL